MAELTIDMTYGTALYEAARESEKEEQILEEAFQILDIFEKEPDLYDFFNYPAISAAEKKQVILNIFEGKICEELLNFLCILIDKGRTLRFAGMIKVFKQLFDHEEGVSYGEVYSVVPLSEDRLAELEAETAKLIGNRVKLENKLDSHLIGGIKILIEDKLIDASIRKKFDDLSNRIYMS